MARFKLLGGGGGGALSWLVACRMCKSNMYEVIGHSHNNSLDLSMGG